MTAEWDVGVVIAAYNARASVGGSVQSAWAAGATDVLVVDDGSTDDTAAVAYSAGARVLRQHNTGAAEARRTGVRAMRSRWLVLLDADDKLIPEGFSESMGVVAFSPRRVIACGTAIGVTSEGGFSPYAAWDRPVTVHELLRRGHAPGPPGQFVWPADVLHSAMFGPQAAVWPSHAEDFELLIRGAAQVPVRSHRVPSLLYALQGGKSVAIPSPSVQCSEQVRAHYAELFGIPVRLLSDKQIRGRSIVRSAKVAAANGSRGEWARSTAEAALLDPRFVGSLGWRRLVREFRAKTRQGEPSEPTDG